MIADAATAVTWRSWDCNINLLSHRCVVELTCGVSSYTITPTEVLGHGILKVWLLLELGLLLSVCHSRTAN